MKTRKYLFKTPGTLIECHEKVAVIITIKKEYKWKLPGLFLAS